MIIWKRWFIGGVGGFCLAAFGFNEYRLGKDASQKPVIAQLSEFEQGHDPANRHVELGSHWAILSSAVYTHEGMDRGDENYVKEAFYPVVSKAHPTALAWESLKLRYGTYDKIPRNEYPVLDRIRVLVRTKDFRRAGDIPNQWDLRDNVIGLIVNDVESLDRKERHVIEEAFPGLDVSTVLILDSGRKPSSLVMSVGLIIGGLAVLGSVVIPRLRKSKVVLVEPEPKGLKNQA